MTKLQTIKTNLETALAQITEYETKNTKAESARIRKTLGEIKKQVTEARAELVTADKAGY